MGVDLLRARRSRARMPAGRRARGLRARGDRGRRHVGALVRPGRRLRAAARVDRRAARRRAGARRHHERLAPGLRLPRRAARAAGLARARRGADVRPAAQDPHAARRRDRRPADGRRRACRSTRSSERSPRARSPRSSTRSRRSRIRAAARSRRSAAGASPSSRASTTCSCSRTTRTGSCATRATALPTIFELEGGTNVAYASSFSKTVAPGVRVGYFVLPPALAAQIEALAVVDVHLAAVPDAGDRARVPAPRQLRAEPRARQRAAEGAARRDARRARAAHARRREWSRPEGGYFIWLDLPRGDRRPARARRGSGRHVRARARTSSRTAAARSRCGSRSASSRRTRSPTASSGSRGYYAARRRRRLRSSCDSRIPTTKPTARLSRISQTSDTFAVANTKCSVHRLAVLEHERDRVRGEQDERDQPDVELRLPVLLQLVRVDRGRAPETHAARSYAAACAVSVRGTSRGCCGGARRPAVWRRNVGQAVSPGRAQRPARRK